MTIENMKAFLMAKYAGKSWAYKVQNMPDDQVIAIYNNIQQRKVRHVEAKPIVQTVWACLDCFSTFIADSDELSECRFCGSKDIVKEQTKTNIRKEYKR